MRKGAARLSFLKAYSSIVAKCPLESEYKRSMKQPPICLYEWKAVRSSFKRDVTRMISPGYGYSKMLFILKLNNIIQ